LSAVLVSPIGPPEYETRLNILIKKAKTMGLKVSRPVLEYVAERVTTDVRRLESCLISLKAKSQLLDRQVDLDMAREALNYLFEEPREGGLTPLAVRTLICRHFHLESSVMTSKDRSSRVVAARNLGIYVARQVTGRTLEEIGQVFGRSHSSALYAINQMDGKIKRDAKLAGKVEFFSRLLLGETG
jgi:chromosomal replication initiator protein